MNLRRRLILSVVTLLVAVLALPVLALQYLNWDTHRDALAHWLGSALNRQVTIAGPLDFQLWPVTRLQVAGLRLASPGDDFDSDLLSLESAAVEFSVWPLLSGTVVIDRLELDRPTVHLTVSPQGQANWHFDQNRPTDELFGAMWPVVVRDALIRDGQVAFAGRDARLHQDLQLAQLTLVLPEGARDSSVALSGALNGTPLDLQGSLRLAGKDDLEAVLDLSLGALVGTARGGIANLMSGGEADLSLELKTPDLKHTMQMFVPGLSSRNAQLLDGDATLSATLRGRPDRDLRLEHVDITAASALLRLTASGSLSLVRPGRRDSPASSRFQVLIETGHLGDLVSLYRGRVPFAATAQAQGTLTGSLGNFRIDDVTIDATGEHGNLQATGYLTKLGSPGGPWVDFFAQTSTKELGDFLRSYGLVLPYTGHGSAGARVSGRPGDTHVTDIDLELRSDSVPLTIKGTGNIGPLGKQAQFHLPFTAYTDDIRAVVAPLGLPALPVTGEGQGQAVLTGKRRDLHVTDIDLELRSDSVPLTIKGTGNIGPLGKQAQFHLPFTAYTDDIRAVVAPLGLPALPVTGEGQGQAVLTGTVGAWSVSDLRSDWLNELGQLSVTGAFSIPFARVNPDLTLKVSVDDLSTLGPLWGLPLEGYPAIGATGSARIRNVQGHTGLSHLSGVLSGQGVTMGRFSGEVPDITRWGTASLAIDLEMDDLARFARPLNINPAYHAPAALKASLVSTTDPAAPVFVTLEASTEALTARVNGQVSALEKDAGFDLKGHFETASVSVLNHLLGTELPGEGSWSASGTVRRARGSDQTLISSITFDTADIQASIVGALNWPPQKGNHVEARIETGSLLNLTPFVPGTYLDPGPVVFAGSLSLGDKRLNSGQFSLTLGNNDLAGSATIEGLDITAFPSFKISPEERLRITGAFQSSRLSLIEIFPAPPEPTTQSWFSEADLPLEWVSGVDLDVDLKVGQLVTRKIEAKNLSTSIRAHDSVLMIDADSGEFSGGQFDMNLTVDTHEPQYATVLEFNIDALELDQIPQLRDKDLPIRGQVDVGIDLTGQGKSVKKMLTKADGSMSISARDAYLPANAGLDFLTHSILTQILGFLNPKSRAKLHEIECGQIGFRVIDGEAISRHSIVLQMSDVIYLVAGGFRFDDETLDIAIKPISRELLGVVSSVVSGNEFFRVRGTLQDPKPEPDLKGAAVWALLQAWAVPMTGGASILGPRLAYWLDNQDPCSKAKVNFSELLGADEQAVLKAQTNPDNTPQSGGN